MLYVFFTDIVDAPKESVEQHTKRECLKGVISKGKVYFLNSQKQRTHESVDEASDETINKTYAK